MKQLRAAEKVATIGKKGSLTLCDKIMMGLPREKESL
jgi:hypothetical protein